MKLVIVAIVLTLFVTYATCKDYQWGEVNPDDDYLIADDKVTKRSWLFSIPKTKYVFKQKKDDTLIITGISISDPKGKCKADVTLTKGGPGKTTATLQFVGLSPKKFTCKIKIYGKMK